MNQNNQILKLIDQECESVSPLVIKSAILDLLYHMDHKCEFSNTCTTTQNGNVITLRK